MKNNEGDGFDDGMSRDENARRDGDSRDELSDHSSIDFDALMASLHETPRLSSPVASARCARCGMTWDRLREDGRAGCATCYETFADELRAVMEKSQRAVSHLGKSPRTAEKRRRRLLQLRARRDHQLELLQRRLGEAVVAEKFEEAAKLRDKIKIVASTIVVEE